MHLFDADKHFLGGHGIVGGQIPLATGVAFAHQVQGTDQVTLCFFGEAAVNQGAFHESLNMAQLWKLPCIYICENNQYGMGTSLKRAMSISDVSQKAVGVRDGRRSSLTAWTCWPCAKRPSARSSGRARSICRRCIEIRTYRFMGHSMSDPGNYRTRAEIEKYQERDPIKVFADSLQEKGVLDDDGLKASRSACARRSSARSNSPTRAPSPRPKNFTRTSTPTRSKSREP